jgi:acyl-CoA dehydrogenase
MFADAIEDILRDQCTPAVVRAIEAGGTPSALWHSLESAGFLELLSPEDRGGAELALPELFPVLCHLGRYAVPVPIGQSIVARALLNGRMPVPGGMLTLAVAARCDADGTLHCPLTPFGAIADFVLAQHDNVLLLLPCASARRESTNVHGSLTASLSWASGLDARRVPDTQANLPAFGAALHAALLAGAMARVFEMTLQYCNDRVQFGKSLGKFQAVQHQLSVMAEHTVSASLAAEAAFRGEGVAPSLLAAAVAKSRASEAAVLIASTAHALHGAIGVTEEYDLQLFTRRLHEWRMAHGSEVHWNLVVGQHVLGSRSGLVDLLRDW